MFLAQARRPAPGHQPRDADWFSTRIHAPRTVNGVNVALSFPIASDHGELLIAQMDLDTAVRPLLAPSRYLKPDTIRTICLDPGHGGKDAGNHTFWHSEKTYTLALALELRDQLQRAGFNVILTRTKDTYVDLPVRPALANQRRADLFVSLHFNATETGKDQVARTGDVLHHPRGREFNQCARRGEQLRRDAGECVGTAKPGVRLSRSKGAGTKPGGAGSGRAAGAVCRVARRENAGDFD